jgi:hypothetical protein
LSKTIDTLVEDIYAFIDKPSGISDEHINDFGQRLGNLLVNRLSRGDEREPTLRLSNVGTPCERKLWYSIRTPNDSEPLPPAARLKFLYGDILEELLLFLAEAAGHTVEGRQTELDVNGVKGHRDAIVDGVLVDCKSASTYSFKKFETGELRSNDPFGYLTQLGLYHAASKDDPLLKEKDVASFLVVDKTLGNLCLDTYAFGDLDYDKLVEAKRDMLAKDEPPARAYEDIPEGKSGNKKLGIECSYCPFKKKCWPGLRTFLYSNGPVYLTEVTREPKVYEVTEET